MLIFIIEIAVGVAAAVNRDAFKDQLKKAMYASKDNYGLNSPDERKIWAHLQSKVSDLIQKCKNCPNSDKRNHCYFFMFQLECCGVDGPRDWVFGSYYPDSCCKQSEAISPDNLCGPSQDFVYQEGCFEKLSTRLREGSLIIMGVGIGIAIIQVSVRSLTTCLNP